MHVDGHPGQDRSMAPKVGTPAFDRAVENSREFSFGDLIDAVNPLQHLPVVSTVYRELTGDELGEVPRMVGSILYGGPSGFISGLANVLAEHEGGKDIGGLAMAAVFGDDETRPDASGVQVAGAGKAAPAESSAKAGVASSETERADTAAAPAEGADGAPPDDEAPLTGLAALRAFAQDSANAQAPTARAPERQEAARPADGREAPTSFMSLAQGSYITNTAARTMPRGDAAAGTRPAGPQAASAAADARAQNAAAPKGEGHQSRGPSQTQAQAQAPASAQAQARAQSEPAPAMPTSASQAPAGADAATGQGELAARMMRALEKYEAMRARE